MGKKRDFCSVDLYISYSILRQEVKAVDIIPYTTLFLFKKKFLFIILICEC